jgi:hypothetical protein
MVKPEPRCWVAVASADHVARGRKGGFIQVSHGKAAPLRRIGPGDRVVYYSPVTTMGERDGLKSFTALGVVKPGDVYLADMGGGFKPFRRDVRWRRARPAPIEPLLDKLELSAGKRNWGYQFRFGLLAISQRDFRIIAKAMGATLPA